MRLSLKKWWAWAVLGLFVDFLSKALVPRLIPLDGYIRVIGSFRISHRLNPGLMLVGSLNLAEGSLLYPYRLGLYIWAIVGMWLFAEQARSERDELMLKGLFLAFVGGLGNSLSYLMAGGVVDFLDVRLAGFRLTNNFADIFVAAGITLAMIAQCRKLKDHWLGLVEAWKDLMDG